MTNPSRIVPGLLALLILAGCTESMANKQDPLGKNPIDDARLNELMLTAGDPKQAVDYFQNAVAEEPDRPDLRRGLALSLARAERYPESARVFQELVDLDQAKPADLLEYAFIAIRLDRWEKAAELDAALPGGIDAPRRHLLTAMLADHAGDWEAADAAYSRAEQMSTNPARILNNWGVSLMSRERLADAADHFERALSYDSTLFSAKNNLAIARGLQGNFQLPLVPMTDREKAMILNNLGIIAARQGEKRIAKGLFAEAVDAHPQHYQAAAARLAALEAKVEN